MHAKYRTDEPLGLVSALQPTTFLLQEIGGNYLIRAARPTQSGAWLHDFGATQHG
jgi:hypothetical protein